MRCASQLIPSHVGGAGLALAAGAKRKVAEGQDVEIRSESLAIE
jgi:hypothetical protein